MGKHLIEGFGTLLAMVLMAVGVFVLFVGVGLATHVVFLIVLKPGTTSIYVVATAVAALLVVAALVLLAGATGREIIRLPGRIRRRATRAN
jgi:hypothetical protein